MVNFYEYEVRIYICVYLFCHNIYQIKTEKLIFMKYIFINIKTY